MCGAQSIALREFLFRAPFCQLGHYQIEAAKERKIEGPENLLPPGGRTVIRNISIPPRGFPRSPRPGRNWHFGLGALPRLRSRTIPG